MAAALPLRPRRLLSAVLVAGALVPAALLLATSGAAAPTLTLPEAEAQLAALQTQEDAAVEAYDAGQIAATASSAAAAAAQTAVTTQTAKLAAMEQGIASFAVATYEGTTLDPTTVLFAGGDPQTVVQRADALGQVAGVHQAELTAIAGQQQVLANAKVASDQRAAASAAALQRLQAAKAHVDALIQQQQAVVSHLQVQARQALLAQQAADRAAALKAAQQARAQAAAVAAAAHVAAQHAAAVRSTTVAAAAPLAPVAGGTSAGLTALRAAESKQGDAYVYGAAGPSTFDCSGLVMWAFAQAGVSLPHSAAAQMGYGTPVAFGDLQPGDLVFYDEDGSIGHVGIYVGNGQMIDANHTGGWVGIRDLYSGYAGARRL